MDLGFRVILVKDRRSNRKHSQNDLGSDSMTEVSELVQKNGRMWGGGLDYDVLQPRKNTVVR